MKHPSALAAMAGAMASALAIAPPIAPSLWARQNLVIPDGPRLGELWNDELTPYIREPLDMLAPDSGVNEIAVMKSAQTGFTTLMIASIGHSIDRDPCRMMVLQPTDAALVDFNKEKLQPAIDETKVLAAKVAATAGRSASSSNTYSKRYPGGSLTLAIASSAADLRSKTIKKLYRDEIDQYPEDLEGQGSPLEQSDARLIAFLDSGDWKRPTFPRRPSRAARRSRSATSPATSADGMFHARNATANSSLNRAKTSNMSGVFPTKRILLRPAAVDRSKGTKRTASSARAGGLRRRLGLAPSHPTISTCFHRPSCPGTRSPRSSSPPATIRPNSRRSGTSGTACPSTSRARPPKRTC